MDKIAAVTTEKRLCRINFRYRKRDVDRNEQTFRWGEVVKKYDFRYAETGEIVAKACRTASCSCPGSAEEHDARYCKHLQDNTIRLFFSIEK